MERVLHGLHWKSLLLYLNDIIVTAPDFDTHLTRLEEVLNWLQKAGLKLKPSKCKLLQPEVHYLGHVVVLPVLQQILRRWMQSKSSLSFKESNSYKPS